MGLMSLGAMISALMIGSASAEPGDASLPGHHPLSQVQAGSLLISELRCAACHSGIERGVVAEKAAPELAEVGARVSADYLRRFLAAPTAAHPGTTMPDVLASSTDAERTQIAEALTHFLVAQSKAAFPTEAPGAIDRQLGNSLFHSVGCVACHGPREALSDEPQKPKRNDQDDDDDDDDPAVAAKKAIKPIAIPLGHIGAKYSARSLSEFLFQPLKVRSAGRMPDMKLTPAEALAIAGYLIGEQPQQTQALVPDAAMVEQGRKYFQSLNCAACHALPGIAAAPLIGSLSKADLTRGCLSNASVSKQDAPKARVRSPRFDLDDKQVQAVVAALRAVPTQRHSRRDQSE